MRLLASCLTPIKIVVTAAYLSLRGTDYGTFSRLLTSMEIFVWGVTYGRNESHFYSNPLFIKSMTRFINPASAVVLAIFLPGCAGKPVIQTQVIEKAVAVPCAVKTPPECKSAYAVDRVSTKDDAVTINRALRAEIEERWACEIKLRAALKGCNKTMEDATDTETAGS